MDCKHVHKFCTKYFYVLKIPNILRMQYFELCPTNLP
jgi:hypothetical protein